MIVFRRPPEQAEEVHKCLRQKTSIAVRRHAHHGAVLPLRQFRTVRRDQKREMRKSGWLCTKSFKDEQVLERIRQVILPADYVADLQIGIVYARRQMIGRHPVRAQQRKILYLVR